MGGLAPAVSGTLQPHCWVSERLDWLAGPTTKAAAQCSGAIEQAFERCHLHTLAVAAVRGESVWCIVWKQAGAMDGGVRRAHWEVVP